MTNSQKALVAEFMIAVAFVSFAAIRGDKLKSGQTVRYWPWPGTLFRVTVSFSIFGVLSLVAGELAATIGGGLLLAAFLNIYKSKTGTSGYVGGVPGTGKEPSISPYDPLTFGPQLGE